MKTYLEIVNLVLAELREDEVTSVSSDVYVRLIGRLVNRAKQQCEDAHDWSALLSEETIATSPGVTDYPLTNSHNRATIDYVINSDDGNVVRPATRQWVQKQIISGFTPQSKPVYWTNYGVDSNGDAVVRLFPEPDTTHNYKVICFIRPGDLEDNEDVLTIPHQPVVDLAIAFAVRERGEVGGTATPEYCELAKRSLSDAIAYDAARNDYDDDWYVP